MGQHEIEIKIGETSALKDARKGRRERQRTWGWLMATFSSSMEEIHSPPLLITSLLLRCDNKIKSLNTYSELTSNMKYSQILDSLLFSSPSYSFPTFPFLAPPSSLPPSNLTGQL